MKKLSIEEKAKAYDDILERARKEYKSHKPFKGFSEMLVHIFPELAESEDEKWIPKEIVKYLKEKGGFRSCWIAWLEKQGEQKPAWSEEDDYNLQCMIAKVVSDIQKGNVGRNQELIDWLKSIKDRVQLQPKQ